jgi:hypothetical protein
MTVVRIDREAAAAALRAAAFRVEDPDSVDYGRTIIHCFIGSIGASWDLDAALLVVSKATLVAWTDNLFSHDLAVVANSKQYNFDVQRSEVDGAPA